MFFFQSRLPFVPGSDTSKAAAESMEEHAKTVRAHVYMKIAASYDRGLTCDEVEQHLGFTHQTVSARIRELAQRGLIKDAGKRRATRSGRMAVAWVSR